MRAITVTATKDIRRRANGSVAFFRGSVEVDGRAIPDLKIQTKAGDEGADDIRVEGGVLTMPEAVAARILGETAARIDVKADLHARLAAEEERLHGHILSRLRPLVAASEAQRDFAEAKRRSTVIRMSSQVIAPSDEDAEEVRKHALFWDEVAAETNARFWLDHDAPVGRRSAMPVFIRRALDGHAHEEAAA